MVCVSSRDVEASREVKLSDNATEGQATSATPRVEASRPLKTAESFPQMKVQGEVQFRNTQQW